MNNNIEQIIIEVILKGDVSGTLPVFNYNYNLLDKIINKGGFIYLPNKILLTNNLFKLEKNIKNNEEIIKKLREVFTSEEAIKNLYKENKDKIRDNTDLLIKNNLNFIIDLFFKKDQDFYLKRRKFKINSIKKNLTDSKEDLGNYFKKNQILLSKLCSLDNTSSVKCSFENLENKLIESYKDNEIKFIKKIDPSLSDDEVNKKAYKDAIEKYKKGNQNDQLKNFANSIIEKENVKNDFKKMGLNYIYKKEKGIFLDINNIIRENIKIELDLIDYTNITLRKKIYIEHGNCKTKKNYIKYLWKKLTRKNKSSTSDTNQNQVKKWVYQNTSKGYELNLVKS